MDEEGITGANLESVEANMAEWRQAWGIDGYMHRIPVRKLESGEVRSTPDFDNASFPKEEVHHVSAQMAKHRYGTLENLGLVDYSATRSLNAYVSRAIPYIWQQKWLRRWEGEIHGQWRGLEGRELFQEFDGRRKGTEHFRADVRYAGGAWHGSLGALRLETRGGEPRLLHAGKKGHVVLWRGERKPQKTDLGNPAYVAREMKSGNLAVIPRRVTVAAVRVRTGSMAAPEMTFTSAATVSTP